MKLFIKQLLREGLSNVDNKFRCKFIYDYLNNLHKNGWEQTEFEDWPWIKEHDYFELKTISLTDSNIHWNKKPEIYSKLTTDYPPIVISYDGWIIDGMHRSSSAIARGDKFIKAYIGHKENQSINETRKSSFQVLKDNKIPLTDEERKKVMDADAIWHHGSNGKPSPAVWKSKNPKTGKVTYVTDTHRAYNTAPTLKGAISRYHNFIKSTA